MNISNLNELLQTDILNEGSIVSVGGFTNKLNNVKTSFAFFSNDIHELKEAVQKGAYALITQEKIKIFDKDIFFLKTENLELCLLRLLRFISEERDYIFLYCNNLEIDFCPAFGLKVLSGNIYEDFNTLIKGKKNEVFCFNQKNYLLKFCANYQNLEDVKFEPLPNSSLFYTSLLFNGKYYPNLHFPYIYAKFFVKFINFGEKNKLKLNFNEKKLDFLKVFFLSSLNELSQMGTKAFLLVKSESHFEFIEENFNKIKGFKTALNNSLFCDFSYNDLPSLKKIQNFRYCLIKEDEKNFLECFTKNEEEKGLFD